jgi:predicted Zn-dependent protease
MTKFKKYVKKIRKKKDKFIKFVKRIGITSSEEFELTDDSLNTLILPCHLGIIFYGDFGPNLYEQINSYLNRVYGSFFFEIRNLGEFKFSQKFISKGVRKEYKEFKKKNDKLSIHPTNKFYQILINERIKENLGMIIALTELPIYSSTEDNIIFLFGEAHLKHRCSVVSALKLREWFYNRPTDKKRFHERIVKEIIHEIGHLLLGSGHCQINSCVMRFSSTIEEIDRKSFVLCLNCKAKLSKVREEFNF